MKYDGITFFFVVEVKAMLKDLEIRITQDREKQVDLEEEYLKVQREKAQKEEKVKRAENCLKQVEKKLHRKQREKYDVR